MSEEPNAPIPDPHVPQTDGLQIGDHRLNTSCGVVERPAYHCGDDLVCFCCPFSNENSFTWHFLSFIILLLRSSCEVLVSISRSLVKILAP